METCSCHFFIKQFQMGAGHHLSLSHQLTVSNGFSLTVWKHIAVTFLSSSFEWGGGHWTKLVCQPDLNLETVTTALHCLQLYLLYSFICCHLVLSCWTGQSYIYYFRTFLSIYSCCCAFDCILLLLLCITEQQLDVISYVKLPFLTTRCQ